jgi:MFS family permease
VSGLPDTRELAADRGLLRNRAFLAIWSAQILSQVAANAITFALIVLVAELTKSNTSSSFLILFAIVPAVLFGIIAGVAVDRSDRKKVLVITNALRAVAVVPLLVAGESVATAYIVNFLVAAITTFFVPAESATIPTIVRRRDLMVANSLFTFTFNGAFLFGFILLAPILIRVAGYEVLFILIALMFVASALLCLTLPPAPAPVKRIGVEIAGAAVAETRQGIGEAFRYLRGAPVVAWSLVYVALTYTLVAVAGALAPGFVREVLGTDERNVIIIVAPAGIGVVAGIGLLNLVRSRVGHPRAIGLGLMLCTAALVALAGARPVASLFRRAAENAELGEAFPFFVIVVSIITFAFGVAYAFITVPAMTLIQEQLHDEIRGRIFGVLNVLVSVFSFLPLVIVGPIADVWGVAPVFLGFAVIVAAAWYGGRTVRRGLEARPA